MIILDKAQNRRDRVRAVDFRGNLRENASEKRPGVGAGSVNDRQRMVEKGLEREMIRDDRGRFVKPAGKDCGIRPGTPEEVRAYFKASSIDAAQFLYSVMMDDEVQLKIRIEIALEFLNRVYGKSGPLFFE